ncbi:MAG TPA: GNAT family N-acetyltransferase [Cyclobacteriaceae bacterium]|nr:GNAT family N-acetyltransferase [Cyclobacteriaceae bacterium]
MNAIIRPVKPSDSAAVAAIIRTVMPEFGAGRQGTAMHDPEVNDIYEAYSKPQTAYFVCEIDGKVVGGGGVAPLLGGDASTCELKKMYFLPEGRGKGLGRKTVERCVQAAKELGFEYCYLETFSTMTDAMALYEKQGFEKIPGPLGNTGHFACDQFYKMKLR